MADSGSFGPDATETEFAQAVAGTSDMETLAGLLDERHEVYKGRSEAAVTRMRGWILARIAASGCRDSRLLPFVREELETGHVPYSVAAAASVLCQQSVSGPEWVPILEAALLRIAGQDEFVALDTYPFANLTRPGAITSASVLRETLRRLQPFAPEHPAESASPVPASIVTGIPLLILPRLRRDSVGSDAVAEFMLEDHDGNTITFRDYFRGYPSFLVFFYTRCNNPVKCSANIARLAELQRILESDDTPTNAHLAAITYDPEYDSPERLRAYACARGVLLSEQMRFFRVPKGFAEFRRLLTLRVNYSQATVNRHASEALILDTDGLVDANYIREVWSAAEVAERLKAPLLQQPLVD